MRLDKGEAVDGWNQEALVEVGFDRWAEKAQRFIYEAESCQRGSMANRKSQTTSMDFVRNLQELIEDAEEVLAEIEIVDPAIRRENLPMDVERQIFGRRS